MRMLVSGHGATDACSTVRAHVVDALRFCGHEVIASDPAHDDLGALSELLHRYQPEILVHIPSPGGYGAAEVSRATAETSTVAVGMHLGTVFPEAHTDLRELSLDLCHYDLVTVPDRWTYDHYRAEGTYRISLMEPAAHLPLLDQAVLADRHGLVAVGDASAENIDMVFSLLDARFTVQVMGRGWDATPFHDIALAPLPYPERGTLYAGAELVIELPPTIEQCSAVGVAVEETPCGQVAFDAAAVATACIALDRPGVAAYFEPGVEIVTYEQARELPELVALVCADPDLVASVGEAACTRVAADHRWTSRWSDLFDHWGVDVESDLGEEVRLAAPAQPLTAALV